MRRFLTTGLIALLLSGSAASVLAHDPIITRPRVVVLEPGESGAVVLEMVNVAGPGEPREDSITTFAQVPAGVRVEITNPEVPSQAVRLVAAQITLPSDIPRGLHALVFEAIGARSGLVLANGVLDVVVPPAADYVGPIRADGADVFLRAAPQRFMVVNAVGGGSATGQLFAINASGQELRVDLGDLPAGIEATFDAGPIMGGLTVIDLAFSVSEGFFEDRGPVPLAIALRDSEGLQVAQALLIVSAARVSEPEGGAGATASAAPEPALDTDPETSSATTTETQQPALSDASSAEEEGASRPAPDGPPAVADARPHDPTAAPAVPDAPAESAPASADPSDATRTVLLGVGIVMAAGMGAAGLAFLRRRRATA